jgi:3-oxoacyl-[acyl-carrier protein] reductase
VLADVNRELGEAAARELDPAAQRAVFCATDVADEASCGATADSARQRFGRIDVLLNFAAITMFTPKPFFELTGDEWDNVMTVNAKGTWHTMKAVVPAMRAAGAGSIINVASNTFLSGRAGIAHYVASKGAVVGLTRSAARELGPLNIRVNCILPGSTATDERRAHGMNPERSRYLVENQSLKREELPADLVGAAVFLASGDSRFMTGQCLNVDGGFVFL